MSVKDRVFLVTGASGNVGRGVTERLLAGGAKVAGLDRAPSSGGPGYLGLVVDLTTESAVEAAFDEVEKTLGPVWGVLHIAGTWKGGQPVADTDLALFESLLSINLRSSFLVGRAAMKRLVPRGGGRIAMVGSVTAANFAGMAGSGAYNISKAGVIALTKVLAEEGKEHGVYANAIAPNTIDTPMNRQAMPTVDPAKWVPLAAVVDALVGVVSPESAVNGAVLTLTGR
jgi:NAD(P)-dependent dehydrogenase (short-subunit alcohol dehydrogenase family)